MKVTLSNQLFDLEKLEKLSRKNSDFKEHLEKIYQKKDFKNPESFINLPFNKFNLIEILELRKKFNLKKLKKLFVIGIGGSIQGTRAIYQLLKKDKKLYPIEFIDYVSIETLTETIKQIKNLDKEEYLIFIVSKSGQTIETIYNFEILDNYLEIENSRIVFITDENNPQKSLLKQKKIHLLTIPKKISGRFSVFTHVGLAPLAFCGVNIIKLLEGAEEEVRDLISSDSSAPLVAASKFLSNIRINENLYSDKNFGELGKWEKQLFNESLGKNDETFFTSFGNFFIEAHSSLQFYLNSSQVFLNLISKGKDEILFLNSTNLLGKKYIGTDVNEINKAISLSIQRDLVSKEIPFITYELDHESEKEIGRYMQFKMHEVLYLGLFYKINPFNQPDVQSHKENFERYLN